MDHELNLALNEITVLMAISSIGILTLIGLFVYVAIDAFFGKRAAN